MPNTRKETFPRRQFLKGAAATAGTVLVGPVAVANSIGRMATPFSIFFWEEGRFIDARRAAKSIEKFERVRITISGFGTGPMQAMDALFVVSGRSRTKPAGFKAWTQGSLASRFEMPVSERDGIAFLLTTVVFGREVKSTIQMHSSSGDIKLREGKYVIGSPGRNLSEMTFGEGDESSQLMNREGLAAEFQYLILSVERV